MCVGFDGEKVVQALHPCPMFIDALTPAEPPPPLGPVSEHNAGPRLGISAAQDDVHARVHGDGSNCPVCMLRVQSGAVALPVPSPELMRQAMRAHRPGIALLSV